MSERGLLGAGEIRRLAEEVDLRPTKRLGQNFVHDANTVRKIVQAAHVVAGDRVLEVGPGLGSLTLGLLEAGASVVAVEIDPRLAELLPRTAARLAPGAPLSVVTADALTVRALPLEPERLVANLPYNVSVPVLLHLVEAFPSLRSALVMVQAEVGERLAAGPGTKAYGGPSVKAAWYGSWRLAGTVSRQVFWPVPNVDSVLVGFERGLPPGDEDERVRVFELVEAAFGQRRKMLRQSLQAQLGAAGTAEASAILESAGIEPTSRGEQLSLGDFLAIARAAGPGPVPGAAR